ncbi:MAG: DUF2207 domain-containing protein [Clostridiales bacterium]|nr:DUF2207 domain-containing protein [Clostridiales bacterium]
MFKKIFIKFLICFIALMTWNKTFVFAINENSKDQYIDVSKIKESYLRLNNPDKLNESYSNPFETFYPGEVSKYDVNVVVHKNNVLDIKETITVNFHTKRHNFIRFIPLLNNTTRADGVSSTNIAQISNITVNRPFTTSFEQNSCKLSIHSNKPLLGKQKYVISYSYNLGKSVSPNYDELYFNIVGSNWSIPVSNITFSINMPSTFDTSKIGFTSGRLGLDTCGKVNYTCINNIISGNYEEKLAPGNALTIRCELPKGYFVNTGLKRNFIDYATFIVPSLFIGMSIFAVKKFGKNETVVDAIEFYPPDNLNSLDIAFLHKGIATASDVTSLLVYLANKGYLKIKEENASGKNITLIKLKEYDGTDPNEKIFLEGLFEKDKTEVKLSSLKNKFYRTVDKILFSVNSFKNKFKVFDKMAILVSICIAFMSYLSYGFVIYNFYNACGLSTVFIHMIGISTLGFIILFYPVLFYTLKIALFSECLYFLTSIFFISIPYIPVKYIISDKFYFASYIFNWVSFAIMFMCVYKISKRRTSYGITMLGKILGFKKFLEVAEKEKLETLITEDPSYFYNILPYVYVLGISSKWIKKFEVLSFKQPEPEWYIGTNNYTDFLSFNTHLCSTMSSANSYLTSKKLPRGTFSSSGTSSGFSGGGFSGQGFGGGGGGVE